MSAVYYRLTMTDGEVSGTPAAIREMVQAYLEAGGTRFWITGPHEFPPPPRSADQRRAPYAADRLCARCFHSFGRHGGLGSPDPDATSCGDCAACRPGR